MATTPIDVVEVVRGQGRGFMSNATGEGSVSNDATVRSTALASVPGAAMYKDPADTDYRSRIHIGDPLCENLMYLMRARKLMGGDIYDTARDLEHEGVPFFADVEAKPSWLDVPSLRVGARLGRRNPLRMLFGVHGALPMTYLDPATVEAMGSTGRLAGGGELPPQVLGDRYRFRRCARRRRDDAER